VLFNDAFFQEDSDEMVVVRDIELYFIATSSPFFQKRTWRTSPQPDRGAVKIHGSWTLFAPPGPGG
jgi:hypothetical protein